MNLFLIMNVIQESNSDPKRIRFNPFSSASRLHHVLVNMINILIYHTHTIYHMNGTIMYTVRQLAGHDPWSLRPPKFKGEGLMP